MFVMRRYFVSLLALLIMLIPVASVRADVVTLEFNSLPDEAEWDHTTWCTPIQSIEENELHQDLDIAGCKSETEGDSCSYVRTIHEFNSNPSWFYEYRVATNGDRAMIPFGGPTVLVVFNSTGLDYTVTLARDQMKLFRDAGLPVLFFDIEPDTPHTIRLELRDDPSPNYRWYLDGIVIDEGPAEGSFPVDNSRIVFHGQAIETPVDNTWHYIRYGDIPVDASGDFDSDGEVDSFEVFYFDECLGESGAGVDAGPGCRWADMDGDTDVDCDDYDLFADAWTAPGDPPTIAPCAVGQIVPAVSDWGVAVLVLLTLSAGTLVYARTNKRTTEAQRAQRK